MKETGDTPQPTPTNKKGIIAKAINFISKICQIPPKQKINGFTFPRLRVQGIAKEKLYNPLHAGLYTDTYSCPSCGKRFAEREERLVRGPEGDILTCPHCDNTFTVKRISFTYKQLLIFYLIIMILFLFLLLKGMRSTY